AKGILDPLSHHHPIRYCPVDLSAGALSQCQLAFLDMPRIEVRPVESTYREGLRSALQWRGDRDSVLVLFLGSSIRNFMPDEATDLFAYIRGQLRPGDLFLFSADLEKDEPRMLAAYNDSLGVTAAFNLNALARLNREMSATF